MGDTQSPQSCLDPHGITPLHRLSSQLTELVYVLRKEKHAQAIAPIHGGTGETLLLCNGADFPKLALTIMPHERLNPRHDEHIIWRDEEDVYRLDAGAFTISGCIDDSKLDKHFTDLGAPGETNKTEGSEV